MVPQRPRICGVSFLDPFASTLNHHVRLHGCVTDGVLRAIDPDSTYIPACDTFTPPRSITPADLTPRTERVRRRLTRQFKHRGFLDPEKAADMLA